MTTQFTASPLWAIMPNQIDSVFRMYEKQLDFYSKQPETKTETHEGVKVVTTNFAAFGNNGDPLEGVQATYDIVDGVAVLPIEGMVIPKSDMFSLIFGGFAALDILTRDFLELKGRDDVHTIILDINSPGGSAFGVQQFANLIYDARDTKAIIAVTSGLMASAAMWIGAAAHKIYITGDVTVVGSIGTVTSHVDISVLEKMSGVKTTEVAAGEFKRLPSMFEPLTTKGKLVLQDQVNHANRAFINDISKFKNVLASIVIAKMAEGRTFIGTQGIHVGLIDGLMTMDQIFESVANKETALRFTGNKSHNNFNIFKGGNSMTLSEQIAELKNSNHTLYEALVDMGKVSAKAEYESNLPDALAAEKAKGVEAGKIEGKVEGQKAEAERIQGIRDLATAGNKELIEAFIADGKTYAPEAAIAILKAQNETAATDLKALEKGSPAAMNVDIVTDDNNGDKGLRQLVTEYQAEHKCSKGVAITACSKKYPDAKNDFMSVAKKSQ